MSNFFTVKAQLQALIDIANAKTGNTDTDLTTAVSALVEGYSSESNGNGINFSSTAKCILPTVYKGSAFVGLILPSIYTTASGTTQ